MSGGAGIGSGPLRSGTADLPLHPGKAPRWLFKRMVSLAGGIMGLMVEEYGPSGTLERISDPFWFQCLSCVLGFDWHSSGTTTVTTAALSQALSNGEYGLAVVGGKGRHSRRVPDSIREVGERMSLGDRSIEGMVYASRMTAKVDSAALQDGYMLYHHAFFLSEDGSWAVVQQGMNDGNGYARRYHWRGGPGVSRGFVDSPHEGILGEREPRVLDTTAGEAAEARGAIRDLACERPERVARLFSRVYGSQTTLLEWTDGGEGLPPKRRRTASPSLSMPRTINWEAARRLYDVQPRDYEEVLAVRGVGPSTIRALSLVADLVYGAPVSWRDPVRYSFAVGGKDGVPYPVDRRTMDRTVEVIAEGIREAEAGRREKMEAIKRLEGLVPMDNGGVASG
ncbi:MAG: DUF763 domain-containing protein [Thermoplasmata archaeon]|nr:DUF763 domain-containing protein [Thermoplasmata archaeon]